MSKRKSFWKTFIIRSIVGVIIAVLLANIAGFIFIIDAYKRMTDICTSELNNIENSIQKKISANSGSVRGDAEIDFYLASLANKLNTIGSDTYAVFYDDETGEILGDSELSLFLIDSHLEISNRSSILYKCPYNSLDTSKLDTDEYFTYITKGDCLTDRKFYKYSILPQLYEIPSIFLPVCHRLDMTDFYIKEGSDSFYPGKCDVTVVDYDSNVIDTTSIDNIAYSIDFSHEEEGFVKYTYEEAGNPKLVIIGSLDKTDSKAYAEFNTHRNQWINDKETDFSEERTNGYPENTLFTRNVYGLDGHCYKILVYSDQSILQAHMRNTVKKIHIYFVILALLVSLIWSLITIAKNRTLLRLIEYRKTLMNTMAHDLKTPLSVMSGYAENLKENVNTDKREHYANEIYENSLYMDDIISDILELSKTEDSIIAPKKEKIDFVKLANEAAQKYSDDMNEMKITLIGEGSFTVNADKTLYLRVFDNLLGNAVKYSKEGSEIKIKGDGSSILIENEPKEQYSGDVKLLWEPFVKGEEHRGNKKGTGIGLSIVRNILSNTGFKGKIEVSENSFKVIIRQKKIFEFNKQRRCGHE